MSIPDLQVTAIRCEAAEGWTIVVVEFQWLDAYHGRGQWGDAVAAAARAMTSAEWRAYWIWPHFVERELFDGGPLRLVAVEQPEGAEAFSSWLLARDGGWMACYSR